MTMQVTKPKSKEQPSLNGFFTGSKKPTPELIDQLAAAYNKLRVDADLAAARLKESRDELLKLAKKFGRVPEKAEKSKRLEGFEFNITASFGESVSVDDAVAEKLEKSCAATVDAWQFFHKVFSDKRKFTLKPEAHKLMSGTLPAGAPRNMRALFNRAVKVEPTAAKVKVEVRKSISVGEAAAALKADPKSVEKMEQARKAESA